MGTQASDKKAKRAAYMREYNMRHREHINAQRRQQYSANPTPLLERNREWRLDNSEWVEGYNRDYYQKHSATIRARSAEWTKRNLERHRAHGVARKLRDPEGVAAYFRDYYQRNKEKYAEYWQNNKERFAPRNRETQHRRRVRLKRALIVPFTVEALEQRLSMFGHSCWMCGGAGEHVDHVIALSKGGWHTLANLRPACGRCNRRKSSRNWKRFPRHPMAPLTQVFKIA
jgi:5-methylcytosine-specific restriction endonuclease McrA